MCQWKHLRCWLLLFVLKPTSIKVTTIFEASSILLNMSAPLASYKKPDSKYFDYSHFAKKFKTDYEVLDTYNLMGYEFKV
jgi:hypothetical protein